MLMPKSVDTTWQQIKVLFDEARQLPADQRAAWLDRACPSDPSLRAEIESLLQSYDESGDFIDSPALMEAAAAEAVLEAVSPQTLSGRHVGPYRILSELGRGGMGVVYLGTRVDGSFDKQVAIKVVPGGGLDATLQARFADERRILATLEHPNIARLLDGGTTNEGLPFVVMEYVEGEPIDAYGQRHALTTRQRLALFMQVCAAVQYSHQRLIVHRDIKAGNILVTRDGVPKLLDFGIAKLLEPTPETAVRTLTMLRVLTPEGASPEQVRGEPVTVATDVYSLGVLLYRLLSDTSPYRTPLTSDVNIGRAICDEQPVAPSDALAQGEAADRLARRREVAGDLDLITLKALRKEPERRYASVEQLADDIGRHLHGRPVSAAPDSWRYRTGKFVHRHRLALGAGTAIVAAIVVGTGVSVYQARVARRERAVAQQRFDMVRKLANAVVFEFNDALQNVPGSTSARKLIVTRAIEYLDSLSRQEATDVTLAREVAGAYVRIGEILGNPYVPNLGDTAGARTSYARALDLYERLERRDRSAETRAGLAQAASGLGSLDWSAGNADGARANYSRALTIYDELGGAEGYRRQAGNTAYLLGQTELRFGDLHRAASDYERAQREYEALIASNPVDLLSKRNLALAELKLGDVRGQLGDDPGALREYRQAQNAFESMLAASPTSTDLQRLAAFVWLRLSDLVGLVMSDERERLARRAIHVLGPVAEADPSNIQAMDDLAEAQWGLGSALLDQHRDSEAETALTASVKALEPVLAANPAYVEGRRVFGYVRRLQGNLAMRRGLPRIALDHYREARTLFEAPDVGHQVPTTMADLYSEIGDAYVAVARQSESGAASRRTAAEWYAKSQARWTEVASHGSLTPEETRARREVDRKLASVTKTR